VAPLPDKTQPHVDRLLGSKAGSLSVIARLAEGRFSTFYRAMRENGEQVMLEVLRLGVTERASEVGSVDAVGCAGVVATIAFGELPDGRSYRLLRTFVGESLEERILSRGPMSPAEAMTVLGRVSEVLQVTHAWAIFHGSLEASTVRLGPDGAIQLIDFGIWRTTPSARGDLKDLGALGWFLVRGEASADVVVPGPVSGLLNDLRSDRFADMSAAHRALIAVNAELSRDPPPAVNPHAAVPLPGAGASPTPRRSRTKRTAVLLGAAALVVVVGAVAATAWFTQEAESENDDVAVLEAAQIVPLAEVPVPEETQRPQPETVRRPASRPSGAVPSAEALHEIITRFERALLKQARRGEDLTQPMAVLNQQRLRLAGSPSVSERRDIAKKLMGWRASYLKR
jgi:hypothetical protein